MTYSELKKLLRSNDCRFDHEGARHEVWYSNKTGLYFMVGRHNSEDCPKGTLSSILKDAGLK
jgi:predicted RNA binding protein YcfA (HicA-like mRNA interferase family)